MTPPSPNFTSERVTRHIAARVNPIRGLAPSALVAKLELWRAGQLREMAILWEEMEEREGVLKNVAGKRKRDVARCDWQILVEDNTPEAQAQKEFLEDFYSRITATHVLRADESGGVSMLIRQMMDAVGKGYAVHEITWVPGGDGRLTAVLRQCPLWFFEARTGRLRFLREDYDWDGIEMPENEWLVTTGDGLMVASSLYYLAKDLAYKDWLNYSEKYGMPVVDVATDAAPGSADWDSLVEAASSFGRDLAIVRNRSAEVNILTAGATGTLPQPSLVEYVDRGMASLWRGADLSTISAGTGAGQGASLQGGEVEKMMQDDCARISETLQQRLDVLALRWKFGPDVVPLAYFEVTPPANKDSTKELEIDRMILDAGQPLDRQDLYQRYGRPLPDGDADVVLKPAAPAIPLGFGFGGMARPETTDQGDPMAALANADDPAPGAARLAQDREALRAAFAEDLAPVRDRLQRILGIEDEEVLRSKLVAFRADLPRLLKSITADPEAARIFEAIYARNLLEGIVETGRKVPREDAGSA